MGAKQVQLGLVVLVVGAGCSALAPPTSDPQSPTATAAPVPSTSRPPTPEPLPPGVEQTGVSNHRELVAAHRTALENTNYTRTISESTRGQNGSVRWQRTRVTAVDGARVFAVLDQSGTPVLRDIALDASHVELYARRQPLPAGSTVAAALTDGGQTEYRTFPSTRHLVDNSQDLALLVSAFETRLVSRDHSGETTVFRVEATGPPVVDRFRFVPARSGISDLRNVTFELLVDERGIVRRYHLAYTATVEGRDLHYERTVHLSAIGRTSVRPPARLDRVNITATPA
jgi:hypothetical protein